MSQFSNITLSASDEGVEIKIGHIQLSEDVSFDKLTTFLSNTLEVASDHYKEIKRVTDETSHQSQQTVIRFQNEMIRNLVKTAGDAFQKIHPGSHYNDDQKEDDDEETEETNSNREYGMSYAESEPFPTMQERQDEHHHDEDEDNETKSVNSESSSKVSQSGNENVSGRKLVKSNDLLKCNLGMGCRKSDYLQVSEKSD